MGGSGVAGLNDRSQGHIPVGHPRSPGLDLPSQFHFALLGFLLEPKEVTPLCEPPLAILHVHPLEPVLALGTDGLPMITEGLATPTPVPQTLTHNIHPELQSQARVRSKPIPVLTLFLRLAPGLCRFSSTIGLFLVSSSGAWAVPLRLMGLLPTFQISLMLSPLHSLLLRFYVPKNSRLSW